MTELAGFFSIFMFIISIVLLIVFLFMASNIGKMTKLNKDLVFFIKQINDRQARINDEEPKKLPGFYKDANGKIYEVKYDS